MKTWFQQFRPLPGALLLAAWAGACALRAAPSSSPTASAMPPAPPKSIFIYPSSPEQGRDPFFPDSMRPYADNPALTNKPAPAIAVSLALKAILGEGTNIFAIVNNHTFAPGEEGDVIDSNGQRTHIRLLTINPQTQTAWVEAGGRNIELHLQTTP